jgi:hypothetical protein
VFELRGSAVSPASFVASVADILYNIVLFVSLLILFILALAIIATLGGSMFAALARILLWVIGVTKNKILELGQLTEEIIRSLVVSNARSIALIILFVAVQIVIFRLDYDVDNINWIISGYTLAFYFLLALFIAGSGIVKIVGLVTAILLAIPTIMFAIPNMKHVYSASLAALRKAFAGEYEAIDITNPRSLNVYLYILLGFFMLISVIFAVVFRRTPASITSEAE